MEDLVGNSAARAILERLVMSGRLPNALLFAGPDGVGKKQFAIELARLLVCSGRDEADKPCGRCSACKRVGTFEIPKFDRKEEAERVFFGQHPDVGIVVPYRRYVVIGSIRALELEANFRPYEAESRIFIIDDADKMNDSSANALLKTLEEPPSTSHIILIASRADSMLPTIRSRCQVIRFAPVEAAEIESHLRATGDFNTEDAALAAHASRGSVGRALQIVPASFRTQRSLMLDVVRSASSGDKRELLRVSEEMNDARNKEDFEENLGILDSLVHDLFVLKNGQDRGQLFNPDLIEELGEMASKVGSQDLARWLSEIEAVYQSLAVNVNRKVTTDALFVGMAA